VFALNADGVLLQRVAVVCTVAPRHR
jgi:hypothetical protein